MVKQLTVSQKAVTLCGICTLVDHPTDVCFILQEAGTGAAEPPQAYFLSRISQFCWKNKLR